MAQQSNGQQQQTPAMGGGLMGGRRPMGPGGGPMAGIRAIEKPKSFGKAMRTFMTYLKPYRLQLIIVFIFAIASTAFMIIGPKMLGNATTKLFAGVVAKAMHTPGAAIDFTYIGRIAITLLILYVISAAFNYIQGYIMAGVSMKLTYTFRQKIAEKVKKVPLKYFDTKTYGEALSLLPTISIPSRTP